MSDLLKLYDSGLKLAWNKKTRTGKLKILILKIYLGSLHRHFF